jgi:hypothetical protein
MAKQRKILISKGNSKIGVNKDTLIMNITSAHDCPSRRLGYCQVPPGACYALRDENFYKGSLPYRRRQTKVWDALSAEEIASQIKDIVMRRRNQKRGVPVKYLRMQESGDFRDASDVDKMSRLADLLKGVVTVYTDTARRDLFPRPHSSNLVINGSGFMVDNNFKVVNADQLGSGYKCRAVYVPISKNPCYGCTLCKTKGGKTIQETLRGSSKRVPNRSNIPHGYEDEYAKEIVMNVKGTGKKLKRPKKARKSDSEPDSTLGGLRW